MTPAPKRKRCPRCNITKPISDFGMRMTAALNHVPQSWCTTCRNGKEWVANEADARRLQVIRQYREVYPNDKQVRSTNTMLKRLARKPGQ